MSILRGDAGDDTLEGFFSDDVIYGLGGGDRLFGRGGDDLIRGQKGADQLKGGAGADTLLGGAGADRLTGGDGRDEFVFEEGNHSGVAVETRDVIKDFESGVDRIDISGLQNDGLPFDFVGKSGFDAENQIRYETDDKGATIFITLDSDDDAEVSIRLKGVTELSGDDFIF